MEQRLHSSFHSDEDPKIITEIDSGDHTNNRDTNKRDSDTDTGMVPFPFTSHSPLQNTDQQMSHALPLHTASLNLSNSNDIYEHNTVHNTSDTSNNEEVTLNQSPILSNEQLLQIIICRTL